MFRNKSSKTTYGIVGLGRFGQALAQELAESGAELIVLDRDEEKVSEIRELTENAYIVKSLDKKTLQASGIQNCDVAVVCIGEQMDTSILTTLNLVSLGIPKVLAKATSMEHGVILEKLGAEVVYPERDMAIHGAVKYASNHVRDFIQLSDEYAIYETSVPPQWVGKSILDLEVRKKYHLNILAIKREEQIDPEVNPNYQFTGQEMVFLMGSRENMRPFL